MNVLPLAARIAAAAMLALAGTAQITPGNLIVTRVGDGAAALSNASTAVFLDEYTQAGVFVQTVPLPTVAAGANLPVTNSGSASSEGQLSQSADGRYLISVGYGTAPGMTGVVSTASSVVPRVVARIGLDGSIDTSTALGDAYSANNIRSATSADGSQFWTAGTAGATSGPGVRYVAALGASTSTQLSTSVTNIRVVNVFGGQLYVSTQSGAFVGVNQVGTGLPVASGETITLLPGFPATAASPYDFWFADASTLYVADDRTNGSGGIQKWTLAASTWTLQYTLAASATSGCRGLSGRLDNGVVTLFATTTNNLLVSVVDAGAASPFTTLATAAANTAVRDVQLVRTPASVVASGVGCATSVGVPQIGTAGGAPVTGNAGFQITAANAPVPTIVLFSLKVGAPSPVGIGIPGAPACVSIHVLPDVLLAEIGSPTGTAAVTVPIPASFALGGTVLGAQVAVFDTTLVGFDLPLGSSPALAITIGN